MEKSKDKEAFYKNGQRIAIQNNDFLTYYFKNGKVKASGISINEVMQGEWKFYRETGELWQIGNFKNGLKEGSWVRFDNNNQVEYNETFKEGKILKKTK